MDVHGGYSKQFWQALGGGGGQRDPMGRQTSKSKQIFEIQTFASMLGKQLRNDVAARI